MKPILAALIAIPALAMSGCGEPAGPSPVQGVWEFDASYGGNGYSCTIAGTTLTLQREAAQWTGNLTGGESFCVSPPGESNVPPGPINAALDSIRVNGSAVSFRLLGEPFLVTGEVTDGQMSGTVQAATPFCQCTEPFLTGTWTATRVDVAAATGRP
jgi:hypothetical protein